MSSIARPCTNAKADSASCLGVAANGVWFLGRRSLTGVINTLVQWGGGPDIDARKGELVPVLPTIEVPVMFVTGTSDDLAPSANTHALARLVPRARVVELAATHFTYDDAPHDYETVVLGFLSEILTRKPTLAGP